MDEKHKRKIRDFYQRNHRMPSYSEVMDLVGFASKNSVHKLVKRLVEQEFISQDEKGRLIPQNIFGQVKVLGLVEAGFPSPAEEELLDTVSLDDFLIQKKEATFMLEVKGDSMKDAGILAGDLVLVERTNQPQIDRIVIARVDGDWTMKYLRQKGSQYYLEAANKNYPPIYPKGELEIVAVVKAIIRKY